MFTGIILDIGTVRSVDKQGGWRIEIETGIDIDSVPVGASICCSGCCLTVTDKTKNSFFADISEETLIKTIIKKWEPGTKVNIEPSLRLGGELGGHFVFGHVDGQARLEEIRQEKDSRCFVLSAPQELARFIAPKGSVTLDGVSLTVNGVEGNRFHVNIIPHTAAHTTLGQNNEGDMLNIEIDMLARYVARIMEAKAA